VPVVRATATTEHVDVRVRTHEVAALLTKLERIAAVEISSIVKLCVAAA
jgi:hypothetical protein